MTSANVTNMFSQISVENLDFSLKSNSKPEVVSFESTLASCKDNSSVSKNVSVNDTTNTKKAMPKETNDAVPDDSLDDFKEIEVEIKQTITKADDVEAEADENVITNELLNFVQNLQGIIKDSMEITDEDLQAAMEVLGVTAVDLTDPQNLAALFIEVEPANETVDLLVNDDFNQMLTEVTDLTENMLEEMNVSIDDFTKLISQIDLTDTSNVDFQNEVIPSVDETLSVADELTEVVFEDVISDETDVRPLVQVESNEGEISKNILSSDDNTEEVNLTEQTDTDIPETVLVKNEQEFNDKSNDFLKKETAPKSTQHDVVNKRESLETFESVSGDFNQFNQTEISFSPKDDVITLPSGETVTTSEVIDQLVEQARITNFEDQTTMEMTLNPAGLGKIYMQVSQKGEEVTAKIFAETEAVKEALESQMANLRTDLNNSSQKIVSVEVTVGTHEFEQNLEQNARNEQQTEEQARQNAPKHRAINLNRLEDLESLTGLMTEEERLVAQIMKDNGNTLDFQA